MKMNKNVIMMIAAAMGAIGFSSCNVQVQQWPMVAWYNVYGQYCFTSQAPGPGCDFYSDNTKATYLDDPNIAPLTYGTWSYTDVYGYLSYYTGYARATSDGVIYDDLGYAINSVTAHGRDALTNAAVAERTAINASAQSLSAKYGLSADVSMTVATSLNDWALIGKSRKRTDQDLAAFSQRVTGLDINQVSAALEASQNGNASAADQAIAKAAATWSTSPDTMKRIISDWYSGNQAAAQ